MASGCRGTLAWRLLVLVLLASVVNANLSEFKELMRRAYAAELDDEDLYEERGLSGSGSGRGGGGSGNGTPEPEPEVCDEAALAAKCAGVCGRAHCRDYPEATCRPKDCDDCTPVWSVNDKVITNCTGRPLQCPGLWVPKGSHCYRVQNRYGFNFKGAQKYCLRQGGHLVSINSATEQSEVDSLLLHEGRGYWTAGYKQPDSGSWVWQQPDGDHPITWSYWNSGEPNNEGYQGFPENRIALKQSSRRWRWNDETGFIKRYPICEAAPEKIQSHCDSKPCMNGGSCTTVSQDMYKCECGDRYSGKYCELYNDNSAWNHHEGHLYLVVAEYSFNRQDATAYCAMHNAYLVSINTEEESDFIKGLLNKRDVSDPTHTFYTGGYKAYVGGSSSQTIMWADGTVVGFKDWGRGEPNRSSERYIMLKFYTENSKWAWNDTPDTWLGGFICEKQSTVVDFKDWGRREPSSSSERYILMKFYTENNKWAWNDETDNHLCGFICEKPATRDSRRNLGASYNNGMLRRLYVKKWTRPDSTMEY